MLGTIFGTEVFSTYVEVILEVATLGNTNKGILHVCGGDPIALLFLLELVRVFSTYVEVIPIIAVYPKLPHSILHVCGGDPESGNYTAISPVYSPRMWR